jgi:hypothetical protein
MLALSATLRKSLILGALPTVMMVAVAPAWADIFDLDYAGSGFIGSLVITASNAGGVETVSAISGTQNDLAATLIPPAATPGTDSAPGFQGNDNTILSGTGTTPIVNFYGISFSTSSGNYNLYSTGSQYALIANVANGPLSGGGDPLTSLTLTPVGAPGPVPGSGLLSLAFFVLVGAKTKARAIADFVRRLASFFVYWSSHCTERFLIGAVRRFSFPRRSKRIEHFRMGPG